MHSKKQQHRLWIWQQSLNQSLSQSINWSINQSVNHSVNQSTSQSYVNFEHVIWVIKSVEADPQIRSTHVLVKRKTFVMVSMFGNGTESGKTSVEWAKAPGGGTVHSQSKTARCLLCLRVCASLFLLNSVTLTLLLKACQSPPPPPIYSFIYSLYLYVRLYGS